MIQSVQTVHDPRALQSLSHPLRLKMLDALREPRSAAGVARLIDQPRQKINYHLKELERSGLVTHAGERRKGNFVEQLFQAVAKRFVVASSMAWDQDKLASTFRDQTSLAQLAQLGEQLQQDAAVLLDQAAFDGRRVASATVDASIRFKSEQDRANFLRDYTAALKPLLKRYGNRRGEKYRVAFAAYPDGDTPPTTGADR